MAATKGDIEDVRSWLTAGAPTESARPWAPILTELPDPELLPLTPSPVRLLDDLARWAARHPAAALVHAIAWGGAAYACYAALAPLAYPPNGAAGFRVACWFAVLARCVAACAGLRLLDALFRRYILYHHALRYQLRKAATLERLTVARLNARRVRCPTLVFAAASALGLLWLDANAPPGADALCGRGATASASAARGVRDAACALLAALPAAYCAIYRYGVDRTEEQAIKEKTAQHRCSSRSG